MTSWITYKLTELCTKIGSGATPKGGKSAYISEGISLIRSQNVLDFTFSEDGLAFINEAQAKALSNVELQERDVLINITGDSVARVCQVPSEYLPARVNQHVAILRADISKLSPEYLKYSLLTKYNKDRLLSLASTGATRNALTKGMLEDFKISAPEDVAVQNRIAEILSALDDKIELNRRMNLTLEQMAQTLFRQYFVDGIDEENLPEGWKWGKIIDLFELQRGFDLPATKRTSGPIPVFAAGGLNGFHNEAKVKGPGITTGRSGVIGNVFYISDDFWPLNTSLFIKKYNASTPLHAFYILKFTDLKNLNSGSAVPTLNRNEVHTLEVIIPAKEAILKFEEEAKLLFQKIRHNEKEIATLTNLRDTLLPKLMSGEIDVMQMKTDEQHEPVLS